MGYASPVSGRRSTGRVGSLGTSLLAAALAAPPLLTQSPLVRLAELLADEIERVAQGRAVEVLPPENRTSRPATLAADLRDLVLARLEGSAAPSPEGSRLLVAPVLAEDARRLVVSARVLIEPEGRLLDLLSVSVDKDPSLLVPAPLRVPSAGGPIEVVSVTLSPPLEDAVLDLELLDEDHLVLLFPDSAVLAVRQGSGLSQVSRLDLPGPLTPVRAPGGIVVPADPGPACWFLTARARQAVLARVEGERLVPIATAPAIPWPGSETGISYRIGTNLLEGLPSSLGLGPHLAADGDAAVSETGELRLAGLAGRSGVRAGSALALAWPGLVATSSAEPPGRADWVQLLATNGQPLRIVETIPVEGAIRALAARAQGDRALLAVAVDLETACHLLLMEIASVAIDAPAGTFSGP